MGEPIRHVYFPTTALVSLMIVLEDGKQVEMAAVGREGLVGLPLALGSDTDGHVAMTQIPGSALRLQTDAFRAVLGVAPELQQVLGRYALVLLTQAGQAAACNGLHALAERGARWLLEAHDRVGSDQFLLTQDFLAAMLGVRRPSVTLAAGMLQQAGYITYHRGRVTVLDRVGLEAASCECYAAIRQETDRLLGAPHPPAS
jgi:CRP-like cAMP-binding protein